MSYGYFPWDILPTEDSLSFFGKENFKKIFSKEEDNYEELSNAINSQIVEKKGNNDNNSIITISNSVNNISIISSIIPIIGLIPLSPLIFIPIVSIASVFSIYFVIFHFLSHRNKYCAFFEKEIKKTGGIVLFKNVLSIQSNLELELNKLLKEKPWTKKEAEYYEIK